MGKLIYSTSAPLAIGAYAQAIFVNGILYISGQIPINPKTGNIVFGIKEETYQVMENLQAILNETGMTFDNVVKTSIFLRNIDDFPIVDAIYASFFNSGKYPARETIQVSALPKNVNIEISMIAHQN